MPFPLASASPNLSSPAAATTVAGRCRSAVSSWVAASGPSAAAYSERKDRLCMIRAEVERIGKSAR